MNKETISSQTHLEKSTPVNSVELRTALACHSFMSNLGNWSRLRFKIDLEKLNLELNAFDKSWLPYNTLKPDNRREGLSLTSLDGKMTGWPDLESLLEINKKNGTTYNELDFKYFTSVFQECESIHGLCQHFAPLGRTHFLRLNSGGHFPPHRDLDPYSFRIIVPCFCTQNDDYVFLLSERRQAASQEQHCQ